MKLSIADKTFRLYNEGKRTFIHIARDEAPTDLKESLKFGDMVTLVNKNTGHSMELKFWFLYDFKENDRFLILVFEWNRRDDFFFKRQRVARSLSAPLYESSPKPTSRLSNTEEWSRSQLAAYSSMFFATDADITEPEGNMISFINTRSEDKFYKNKISESYVITDVLKLKTTTGKMFKMYSVFPMGLWNG